MVLEPPRGDFVDHFSRAIDFVYNDQCSFVCIFKAIVGAKKGWRGFAMQKDCDVRLVFLRVDIDALDFSKLLEEIVALKEKFNGFVARVTEEGHGYLGSVRMSMPSLVFTTVCSHWALKLPSRVTAVQPSARVFVPGRPTLSIGSTVNTLPTSMNGQRS